MKNRLLIAFFGILVGITAFLLLTRSGQEKFVINTDSTAVIKQIRELQRLETASYTIEKVIDAGTSGGKFEQFLFGDRILLIAHGEVIAGIDLSGVDEDDVQVEGKTVTITLPAPQILTTRLDNEQTRVYDRQTGVFTKGDKDLEAEARKAAEETVRAAACEGEILETAGENARKQLTAFLKALEFETVTITLPEGTC